MSNSTGQTKPRRFVIGDIVQLDPAHTAQNPGAKRAAQYVLSRNGSRPLTGRRDLHGHMLLPSGKLAKAVTVITWPVLHVGLWHHVEIEAVSG